MDLIGYTKTLEKWSVLNERSFNVGLFLGDNTNSNSYCDYCGDFPMRGWKWVVFMWSSITGVIVTKWVMANPGPTVKWLVTPGNGQLLSLFVTMPLMIWLIKYMLDMMKGSGKDPRKWWKEDEDKGQF